MSKNTLTKLFARIAPVAILMFIPAVASADLVTVSASASSVRVGDTIDLDIIATGLQIGAFDLTLDFNALLGLVDENQVTFGGYLGGPLDSLSLASLGLDSLDLTEISFLTGSDLAALQSGTGYSLAHIRVKALAAGRLSFDFLDSLFSDYDGHTISGVRFQGATIDILDSPPPSPVPEPNGSILMLSVVCFVGSGLIRKSRKMAASRAQQDERKGNSY